MVWRSHQLAALAAAVLACGAATGQEADSRHLQTIPGSTAIVNGGFELDLPGAWNGSCASIKQRVRGGEVPGGPTKPRSGSWMYRFKAASGCGNGVLSQTLTGLQSNMPYHVMVYVWLPTSSCTTSQTSGSCPQLLYSRDGYSTGSGTTVTAVAGQWNLISGTVWTSGASVKLSLSNLPAGTDVWIDDFAIRRCGLDDFRSYSDEKINQIRKRNIKVNFGARNGGRRLDDGMPDLDFSLQPRANGGDGGSVQAAGDAIPSVAKVVHLEHGYPFGAAMFEGCTYGAGCKKVFKKHFNFAVAEVGMKWQEEEPCNGCYPSSGKRIADAIEEAGVGLRVHSTYWEKRDKVQDWVANLKRDGSSTSLQAHIWGRMQRYTAHYKATGEMFDVNNEMLHGSFFTGALPCGGKGPCICDYAPACPAAMGVDRNVDIHTWMYRASAYLVPGVRMFLNDYCMMHYCGSGIAVSSMVKQARAIPDATGMGVQMHLTGGKTVCGFDLLARFNHAAAGANFKQTDGSVGDDTLYTLKKKFWVTENDIQEKDLTWRGIAYEMAYRAAFASPAVDGHMIWGWKDEYAWRPDIGIVNSYNMINAAGAPIIGPNGLLHSTWNSTDLTTTVAAGAAAPNDDVAPAGEAYLSFNGLPGKYTVELEGCKVGFKVPVGRGPIAFDAKSWTCKNGSSPRAAPAKPGAVLNACRSGTKDAALSGAQSTVYSDSMTPAKCVAQCAAAKAPYAALSGGNACTCGAGVKSDVVGNDACGALCAGDGSRKCGGGAASSVYLVATAAYGA